MLQATSHAVVASRNAYSSPGAVCRYKMTYSPDYNGVNTDEALSDFKNRIEKYEEVGLGCLAWGAARKQK